MRILAVETSCDETAIAVAEFFGSQKTPKIRVLSNIISSQVKLHAKFGGVVPNLAKREHQKNLVPILLAALKESGLLNTRKSDFPREVRLPKIEKILEREQELLKQFKKRVVPLAPPKIDVIAVTYGPGLAPALWVGVNFAKALAYLWNKPLIPVDHMAGHLYSAFLQKSGANYQLSAINYPALALLVSGGHTQLVLMRGHRKLKLVGETLDDAVGEAFDKVARILGLGYPGGPQISQLAKSYEVESYEVQPHKHSESYEVQPHKRRFEFYEVQPHKIYLPRPMLNSNDHNFSFSGLKTAVLYLTRDLGVKKTKQLRPIIAQEFQNAVVEVLVKKTIRAAKKYKVKMALLGGGVAANELLRQKLSEECEKLNVKCQMSNFALTGDNALMIAAAAYFAGKKIAWRKVQADANTKMVKTA